MQILSANPAQTLIWHEGRAISRATFTHGVLQLATRLPAATHVINLCHGRLAFVLSFVAAAVRGHITLLPPNQTDAALLQLKQDYPDHQVLDDTCLDALDLQARAAPAELNIDADRLLTVMFTSGSTGTPQPQLKTWRMLAHTGLLDAQRFVGDAPMNLLATVPAQHMFGLQTTVLLPLMSHCAIGDARPFFPADIRAALQGLPAPRALITTPTHLRACVASGIELPELQFILSATAPLPLALAQQAETRWRTQVLEIYGSTEAGTMATRRSTQSEAWQLLAGATLNVIDDAAIFRAPHLPEALPLSDHVELLSAHEFKLLGRATEQLKIAGKRASLGELNHALLQIPGVIDGVVFLPPGAERTAALVVSALTPAQILDALAQSVDAVFLPRPLLKVEKLPRNEVGKLTQAALQAALVKPT